LQICAAESDFFSVVHFPSRKDLMRQSEIGENVSNKPSFNYE